MTLAELWALDEQGRDLTVGDVEDWPVGDEDRHEPATMGELWALGEDW